MEITDIHANMTFDLVNNEVEIHVLTATFNRVEISRRFCQQITSQTFAADSVTIVDDCSLDRTKDLLSDEFPNFNIISTEGNFWWGKSIQFGIDYLLKRINGNYKSHYLLILNDDILIDHNFILNARRIISSTKCLAACAMNKDASGAISTQGYNFEALTGRFTQRRPANVFPTRGFLVKMELLIVHKFYSPYFPHYISDFDFTIRLHNSGVTVQESEDFCLTSLPEYSGSRNLQAKTYYSRIRELFSLKCVRNPIPLCNFVFIHGNNFTKLPIAIYKYLHALSLVLRK